MPHKAPEIFVTESAPNTFTRLPVRAGEHVVVWFGTVQRGPGPTAARLQQTAAIEGAIAIGPLAVLELEPTPRSLLGHDADSRQHQERQQP